MVIDAFVFNKEGRRNSVIYNWAAGAFLTKTGAVGKANPEDVAVRTPVVTIGIRGTQFWGGRLERDFEVLVLEGRVVVTNAAGPVELGPNQTTAVIDANTAPAAASVMPDDRRTRAFATVQFQN
ncbi:MAG: FecR domain-containing protein [Alphaproteobacteria bacterium]|nr:FecR domain-containing protein [Alphaproteobacteria bacterium]